MNERRETPSEPKRVEAGMPSSLVKLAADAELILYAHGSDGSKVPVFNREMAELCLAVKRTQSLYAAAEEIGRAYSCAWKMTSKAERALGGEIFARRGSRGTALTDLGEKLLNDYLSVCEDMKKRAAALYAEAFDDQTGAEPSQCTRS